jgi:hypothetical protein
MKSVTEQRQYYMLIAAREFSRGIRDEMIALGYAGWSAPADLRAGDLALLYEKGKPDRGSDLRGRMQFGWLMRAVTEPKWHPEWGSTARFEAYPFHRPLPLAEAKQVRRFAEGPGKMLIGGHRHLDEPTFRALLARTARLNPELNGVLDSGRELNGLFRRAMQPDQTDRHSGRRRAWRNEHLLQDACVDAIDEEGWARQVADPIGLGLRPRGDNGFSIPGRRPLSVDDVMELSPRHLLVVEYEMAAHGNPMHGAQKVHDYGKALEAALPGHTVDALVIAPSFSDTERGRAMRLGVECLRADTRGRGDGAVLREERGIHGSVDAARRRARTTTSSRRRTPAR